MEEYYCFSWFVNYSDDILSLIQFDYYFPNSIYKTTAHNLLTAINNNAFNNEKGYKMIYKLSNLVTAFIQSSWVTSCLSLSAFI